MGANNLLIMPGWAITGSVNFGSGTIQSLTPADMNEIYRQCPAVSRRGPHCLGTRPGDLRQSQLDSPGT